MNARVLQFRRPDPQGATERLWDRYIAAHRRASGDCTLGNMLAAVRAFDDWSRAFCADEGLEPIEVLKNGPDAVLFPRGGANPGIAAGPADRAPPAPRGSERKP